MRRVVSLLVPTLLVALVCAAAFRVPSGNASGRALPGYCAWGFVMSPENNVIWPETNAVFWTTPYILFPGSELVVRGSFPEARYMSVKTYGFSTIVDSLNDQQIRPDAGSSNPFVETDVPADPDARRYTVRIRPGTTVVEDDNVLAAFADAGSFGIGFLSYRVYVPDDPSNVAGGPLPDVSIRLLGGLVEKPLPTCPQATTSTAAGADSGRPADARGSDSADTGVTPITFEVNSAEHLFPNPDDAYLVGPAPYERGRIAVVRAKAAAFPDTRAGAHVTDPHDLRYWSMCVHMLTPPLPTADCAGDFETVLGSDGYYTYVISLPRDRPDNATPEDGITWLPRGRPGVDVALTLRNMLPGPGFAQAIQNVEDPGTEAAIMGEYYPQGGICTVAQFESGGAAACLPDG